MDNNNSTNKQSIIGFVLITLIFGVYIVYNSYRQQQYEQTRAEALTEQVADQASEQLSEQEAEVKGEDTPLQEVVRQEGSSLLMCPDEVKEVVVTNNEFTATFSSRGAHIKDLVLKDYTKYAPKNERNELVHLFDPSVSSFNLSFFLKDNNRNIPVNTAECNFDYLGCKEEADHQKVTFRLNVKEDTWVDFIYLVYSTEELQRNYMVDLCVDLHNVAPLMANQTSIGVDWRERSFQNERSYKNENMYTNLVYHFPREVGIEDLGIGNDHKSKNVSTSTDWVSFKQQYFSGTIFARSCNFSYADLQYQTEEASSGFIKTFSMAAAVPYTLQTKSYDFSFYLGPNKFSILKKIEDADGNSLSVERIVPLGWIFSTYVSRWVVIPVFDFLRKYIDSFGLIILILTILVKVVIFPLTYKSYLSTAKMRVLKPELEALKEKYPDDMKRNQATMNLYKKAGISPMGGCIPMLIQMPVLIAMFRFFPASIELRGQSFLWSDDLSSYDSVLDLPFNIPFYGDHVSLFTLLMAISLFAFSYVNYQQTASTQPQMAGMKFMTVYMMPAMMLFWFNDYASGLSYYYLLSNLFTVAQTFTIKHFIDEDKIHRQLQENLAKKGNGKKSRFQLKYEELMREQEKRANK